MNSTSTQDPKVRAGAVRWLLRETMGNLLLIGMMFGISGRWNWGMAWVLSGIYVLWSASLAVLILPVNPAMLAERARPHADTEKWDRALLFALGILMVATYVVASLDARWHWSRQMPPALQIAAAAIAVLGQDVLLVWAMTANAFFVATVRIQTERSQTVVSRGPYRHVRHPGYAGVLLLQLATPFMLGSLWAIIPAGLSILVLFIRTGLEDKTLLAGLPGYREYADRVRHRLLPGIW